MSWKISVLIAHAAWIPMVHQIIARQALDNTNFNSRNPTEILTRAVTNVDSKITT
jgi:hypothetical protein